MTHRIIYILIGLIILFLTIWQVPKWQVNVYRARFDESTLVALTPKEKIEFEIGLITAENNARATLAQIIGGLLLILSLGATWYNIKATQKSAQETIRINEEGKITERFSKAIELLGNAQIEVRLGGIYALERIARDSQKDHWTIIEVLSSFVREKAQLREGDSTNIQTDIQAILTVIGRRKWIETEAGRTINLSNANLSGAILSGAILNGADFSGAILNGADFDKAILSGANFNEADLRKAKFVNADLSKARLIGANLNGAYRSYANLHGVYLRGADLTQASIHEADISEAYLLEIKFIEATLTGTNFSGTDLSGANFCEANLSGTNLKNADLNGAHLRGANLFRANLSGARLTQDLLSGASFKQAILSESNLSGADLSKADLSEAHFNGANFKGANLKGSDLSGALGLTKEQIADSIRDASTKLPSFEKGKNLKPFIIKYP